MEITLVRNAMPRDRFRLLKKYLHFRNNREQVVGDKTFKIQALLDLLNSKFMQWNICDKHIAIDEAIVPYYGRSTLKQFMRGKPIRLGFKHWCIVDKTGYCYRLSLYTGRDRNQPNNIPLGTRVVNNLLDACVTHPQDQILFFDNFSSVNLMSQLAD